MEGPALQVGQGRAAKGDLSVLKVGEGGAPQGHLHLVEQGQAGGGWQEVQVTQSFSSTY